METSLFDDEVGLSLGLVGVSLDWDNASTNNRRFYDDAGTTMVHPQPFADSSAASTSTTTLDARTIELITRAAAAATMAQQQEEEQYLLDSVVNSSSGVSLLSSDASPLGWNDELLEQLPPLAHQASAGIAAKGPSSLLVDRIKLKTHRKEKKSKKLHRKRDDDDDGRKRKRQRGSHSLSIADASVRGSTLLGKRVKVFWEAEQQWFCGRVALYNASLSPEQGGEYMIEYDDGDVQMEVFESLVFDNVPPNPYLEGTTETEGPGSTSFKLAVRELSNYYQRWENPAQKRAGRWRNALPETLAPNFSRALSDPMKVLWRSTCIANTMQFRVMGSDGATIHSTDVCHIPKCSCRAASNTKDVCEHTVFVLMNVLGVPRRSPFLFQRFLVDEELAFIFRRASLIDIRLGEHLGSAPANPDAVSAPRQTLQAPPCMICFRNLQAGDSIVACSHHNCGGRAHGDCAQLLQQGNLPASLCPKCCAGWENESCLSAQGS